MYRKIVVPYGVAQRLAAATGCNRNTVRWALAGVSDTILAQTIRKRAVEEYGGKFIKVTSK